MGVDKILGIANNAISLVQKVSDVNGVKVKMDSLEMNMGMVSARKVDITIQLEQEERRSGKKRKKEVDFLDAKCSLTGGSSPRIRAKS
ncbi:hypothetical protein NL676_024151 [Syzygium grande]|nr:hypothetical protein NL676_024151 [Syzygium grande]